MSRFKFTREHLSFLRIKYLSMNVRDLTLAFNSHFCLKKTESSIRSALRKYKIRCGRNGKDKLITHKRLLTYEQDQFVRTECIGRPREETLKLLNKKFSLNIKTHQYVAYTKNHKISSGLTGCFEKNQKPWNAGTKGQGLTGANSGSFKKGDAPINRKPLGSERICPKDGFILIKVAEKDPHAGFNTRYKHKKRHVWEKNFGPIPEDKIVAFIDGDKLNCDPENLMLISRAELLTLNRYGYREMPKELKPTILAVSKLKVATKAIERETF